MTSVCSSTGVPSGSTAASSAGIWSASVTLHTHDRSLSIPRVLDDIAVRFEQVI